MASTIPRSQVSLRHSMVRVIGELDLVADPRHEFAVLRSAVTLVDCSGPAPLLETHATLGGQLRLCDPSPAVSTLLHLVGRDAGLASDQATPAPPAGTTAAPAGDLVESSGGPWPRRPRGETKDGEVPAPADVEPSGVGVLKAHLAAPDPALSDRVVIEHARGMLMASLDCDADQASHALLRISWDQEVTVVDATRTVTAARRGGSVVRPGAECLIDQGVDRPRTTATPRPTCTPVGAESSVPSEPAASGRLFARAPLSVVHDVQRVAADQRRTRRAHRLRLDDGPSLEATGPAEPDPVPNFG